MSDETNPKQFCIYHVATEKNPEGTDCAKKLTKSENARKSRCPYSLSNINPIRDNNKGIYIGIEECPDFAFQKGLAKILIGNLPNGLQVITEMLKEFAQRDPKGFKTYKKQIAEGR